MKKMGKSKQGMVILAIMVVLLAAACGNNGQPAASSGQTGDGSAPEPSFYATSVFLGDSITEGLSYHDVLDVENVLAGAGKTAHIALETGDVDELVSRMPEHVYIQLGSDDILWPTDDPVAYSLSHYAQLIEEIHKQLPDASITLLSVTPVTAEAEEAEPRYGNIAEYNERLKALAAEKQVEFIDLSPLVADHADLYDTDGIHFQAEFYPLLLGYLQESSNLPQRVK
ncbi:lysophospholipase [Xylanibacillus composti]|uniref:Lipase n=1 Tax=Xylanibacillus composti TaxID=1572762 RepID=A0A8J4M4B0_9BACL|nr:GDSL-type esterase/lipase family protein [Xylanibacillus composti]MDT9727167.1 lysophospholipase [Xylanibacillus composti]GIQ70401.1 lipase [Xylanibacillus composti]